jgi:hypothetical protein
MAHDFVAAKQKVQENFHFSRGALESRSLCDSELWQA